MRVWFLKETKSVCTSCATAATSSSVRARKRSIATNRARTTPSIRRWMCDSGRLNYKWIGREDRLTRSREVRQGDDDIDLDGRAEGNFRQAEQGRAGFGRDRRFGAADERRTVPARKAGDETRRAHRFRPAHRRRRQTAVQRGPQSEQQRRAADRHCARRRWARTCRRSPRAFATGRIKTLIVFGEDVTKHGIGADLLGKLETLIVSDILPNETTEAGALPVARLRARGEARHVHERQRPRAEIHEGRRAARRCPAGMGIFARTGFQRHRPERLREHRRFVQPDGEGSARVQRLTWAGLGDTGVTVPI